ncbi:phage terminase large subunit [bacterium]|nr:phage terminase large subunit [bacterium]
MSRQLEVRLPAPLPHQLDILRDPARFKVICAGRRFGKTILGLLACVEGHGPPGTFKGALEGATIWWVAPTYAIASAIWRDLKAATRGAWLSKNENERRIAFHGGGSVTVKSADAPDSLRGVGLDGICFDEAAHCPTDEAYAECLRPALADRQGWAIFISTPAGRNWFADLFDQAARPGCARWQRPTSCNPKVAPAELEAARAELGSYVFAQEFDAQFVVAGGGLMHESYIKFYDEPMAGSYILGDVERVELDDLGPRFGVVDLAASLKTAADKTCALACGLSPRGRLVIMSCLWDRLEAPELIPRLEAFVERWRLSVLYVEAVGYQLSMIQMLRAAGLNVRELKPGSKDKVSRFLPAVAKAEGGGLWLPRSAPWTRDAVTELTAFPKGGHDDFCDALGYSVMVLDDLTSYRPGPPCPPPKPKHYLLPGTEMKGNPCGWGRREPRVYGSWLW